MYAVINTGGKQYKVEPGCTLSIEKQAKELGETITFNDILLVQSDNNTLIGKPKLDNCSVTATIKAHGRQDKINVLKFKRRKHHMKHMGHRQWFTKIEINNINIGN